MSRTRKGKKSGCPGCPQCWHNRPERQRPAPDPDLDLGPMESVDLAALRRIRDLSQLTITDLSADVQFATDEEFERILAECMEDYALELDILKERGD